MYTVEKNLNKLYRNSYTYFMDPKEQIELKYKLKNIDYKVLDLYKDSVKKIFYTNEVPEVLLYEIKSNIELRHQDILGTMYSLNISPEMFGDIIIKDNKYYIYILKLFENYFVSNFTSVRNARINLIKRDISLLEDYEINYEEIEIISSSERIDSVISRIISCNRNEIKEKIKNKEIMLNYDYLKNNSYILKENDVFSIRKFGKYKYGGIIKKTKKDNYIIKCYKYL